MYVRGARKHNYKILALCGVIACLAVIAGTVSWKYRQLRSNPNAIMQRNTDRILKEVGQLYQLPADEQPTVAQIQDKEKLKDQSFFDTSQNGDYVIIYTNSKLAMVYREKEKKLIKTGPINVNDNTAPPPKKE